MDITELILADHHEQRRLFALLDDIDRKDAPTLKAVWQRLARLLEVHATAEEELFYPRLLKIGTGGGSAEDAPSEVEDAISDHNEIRDGVRKVAQEEFGSDAWWSAVVETRESNSDHMAEEEREDLPDFRRHADLQTRHDIAVAFLRFEAQHPMSIDSKDKDPEQYVSENS